jgi:uncharacterized protein
VLFNTILAAKVPDSDGNYPYYSTYSSVAEKVFYPKKWPCCSGTLAQTVADYPLNLYFQSTDGLYINLYTPSRARFMHAGQQIEVTQETRYPMEDSTSFELSLRGEAKFTMYLRIPAWVKRAATVRLNGRAVAIPARPGTYAAVSRTWRTGDRLELTLPQEFRTEAIDDVHPDTVALMRGAVEYVAISPAPDLGRDRLKLPSGLKQVGAQAFVENYEGNQIVFVPLYQVRDESYTSYFAKG